ncbi:hypothetical protein Mal48_06980 [Thalassoglobus polymorphus]|uniref:Uncharacterized protein n=1 Tax=Thalassoglobus polymorphus TaxID=2527994 RepID=A0A517QIQ4_9PLAN|nr:hypothetical protein Mal48_06980 [Thalassoglobus polymorphus]
MDVHLFINLTPALATPITSLRSVLGRATRTETQLTALCGTLRLERSVRMGVANFVLALILPPLVMFYPFEAGRLLLLRTSEPSTIPNQQLSQLVQIAVQIFSPYASDKGTNSNNPSKPLWYPADRIADAACESTSCRYLSRELSFDSRPCR